MYICTKCGYKIDSDDDDDHICPKCRCRILTKEVPKVKRTIKSR